MDLYGEGSAVGGLCVIWCCAGAIWSPKKHKTTTIGSYNSRDCYDGDDEDFRAEDEE